MLTGTRQRRIWALLGWLGLCYAVSAVGAVASIQAREFYADLAQPAWAPPGSIFGPVWTILYGLMAIAAWLVWKADGSNARRVGLWFFLVQLIFNGVWSWLFFVGQWGLLAFVDIVVLWGLILATMVYFLRVRPLAAILLLPYLLWVSFAGFLNYAVWRLNPIVLGMGG
jgi:benzodiazapine receptor